MELSAGTMGKIEDWLETMLYKNTWKNYLNGIKKD